MFTKLKIKIFWNRFNISWGKCDRFPPAFSFVTLSANAVLYRCGRRFILNIRLMISAYAYPEFYKDLREKFYRELGSPRTLGVYHRKDLVVRRTGPRHSDDTPLLRFHWVEEGGESGPMRKGFDQLGGDIYGHSDLRSGDSADTFGIQSAGHHPYRESQRGRTPVRVAGGVGTYGA